MEADFWKQRWAEGRTAFHEGVANRFLVANQTRLTGRVLVPMCGKTEDLAYLAGRGHEVIGVELVEDAVAAFFAEHDLTPHVDEPWAECTHRKYSYGAITIIAGDWFTVTRDMVGTIDSVYDRAALVAMPAEMRFAYVAQLRKLVDKGKHGVLVALAYEQARFEGPPFSVDDHEVHAHYPTAIKLDEHAASGRIGDANIGALERCYAITI